ncbi:hypothetical protein SAMN05660464_0934 [Geodermatophilus dictyosporus]|uniref:Uncharacterized protein n=1 Tax=Geodermatophilus dictyosporus TaxID=1523247 RepID=A0A1I5JQ25_9ACTN|nr:hypothetical protein [Geodermatophilus dictyosporus]SFO74810.1 hypothetical protein SAMN05660464_0934 [Geodermatophilus dictyosporus]
MTSDSIGRLAVTWHPDTDPDPTERARLDRLAAALADGGLPDGLSPGPDRDLQVCVRRVRLPRHHMRWDATDDQLVSGWARVVERTVAGVVAGGGPDVVRYRSRTQAREDLVTSVLQHDRERAWAWQLLGLWPPDTLLADPAVVLPSVLAELGRDEPGAVVGLLVTVTSTGQLQPFAEAAGEDVLAALVEAAWRAAGGRAGDLADTVAARTPAGTSAWHDGPVPATSEVATAMAELRSTVLHRSVIARALRGSTVSASPRPVAALWAAAVLEVEPALAAARAGAVLAADLAAGRPAGLDPDRGHGDVRDRAEPGARTRPGSDSGAARRSTAVVPATGGGPPTVADPPSDVPPPAPGATGRPPAGVRPDRPRHGPVTDHAVERTGHPGGGPSSSGRRGTAPAERPARTGWGGLLFLLSLVADLGLPARVAADPARFGPALRPVLHGLARLVVARAVPDVGLADPGDPAVLAFAGLVPGADPPGPVPRDVLGPEVEALITELAARLDRGPAGAATPGRDLADERALLVAVCRRRAVIEADPGWIDVLLDPDEVSVDVRRAGLDLDPGHLPWLGCVVRFRYG